MTDAPRDGLAALNAPVQQTWQRFLDVFEPLRPELYRYCRYLTRSAWEAEDLAQDTLARGFVTLGTRFHALHNPRAWLFRVASNLWIDRARRARLAERVEQPAAPPAPRPVEVREAAGTLLVELSPQERAAVALKDVFDLSLDEVAEAIGTTVNAVKAALHRGRGKLAAPEAPSSRVPAAGVLDAFCAAFNAGDLERLTALLLDTAAVEIVGVVTEYGGEEPRDPESGSFAGLIAPIVSDHRGGIAPELLAGYLGTRARCDIQRYRDEPILAFWYAHDTGEAVRTFAAVETEGDRLARVRNYFFSPDVIAEIGRELDLPYRTNGYRYW